MKYLLFSLLTVAVIGCSNEGETNNGEATNEEVKTEELKEFAYQCPMKCEGSGSDTEGKCDVCKMDLVQM
ncbi:MAG: hypothetical protein HRT71_04250 [Flavobacteriales bacterium]|nr:hypothetical protein [Flavobacteriales bacterium]